MGKRWDVDDLKCNQANTYTVTNAIITSFSMAESRFSTWQRALTNSKAGLVSLRYEPGKTGKTLSWWVPI